MTYGFMKRAWNTLETAGTFASFYTNPGARFLPGPIGEAQNKLLNDMEHLQMQSLKYGGSISTTIAVNYVSDAYDAYANGDFFDATTTTGGIVFDGLTLRAGYKGIGVRGGKNIVGTSFDEVLPTQDYINPLKVAEYKSLIQSGVKVPAIEAYKVGGKIFIEEGHHRFVAHMELGKKPSVIIRDTKGPIGYSNWLNTTFQLPPFGH